LLSAEIIIASPKFSEYFAVDIIGPAWPSASTFFNRLRESMKTCGYCGTENPDEATRCATCLTELVAPASAAVPPPETKPVTPLEEQRFWERMTFRQFAALFLRLQALWLLWYAVLDLTYLPQYFGRSYVGGIYLLPGAFRFIVRLLAHVAAAVAVIQYADRILSWLVRDWIRNQPPELAPEPTAVTAGRSATAAAPPTGDGSSPRA
jgi:hypothetical protein